MTVPFAGQKNLELYIILGEDAMNIEAPLWAVLCSLSVHYHFARLHRCFNRLYFVCCKVHITSDQDLDQKQTTVLLSWS
jgi:hypothetical protein